VYSVLHGVTLHKLHSSQAYLSRHNHDQKCFRISLKKLAVLTRNMGHDLPEDKAPPEKTAIPVFIATETPDFKQTNLLAACLTTL
jgi:hypothetical protein